MDSHLIEFDKLSWVSPADGVRYKAFTQGNQRVRLVEFSEGFREPDWCLNGPVGTVLKGSFSLDFNGKIEQFKKDDVYLFRMEKLISIRRSSKQEKRYS